MTSLLDLQNPGEPEGLRFDAPVPPGGYAWWYLDVVSDDRAFVLTVIALVGSAFSPRYARARALGPAAAEDFCAVNVALRGPGVSAWVMTEWPRARVRRDAHRLRIGASEWLQQERGLALSLDELTAPFPRLRRRPLSGLVVLTPLAAGGSPRALDAHARHRWYPLAPVARAVVDIDVGRGVRFAGTAYHDANAGDDPLANGFRRWSWSRLSGPADTIVSWDLEARHGAPAHFASRFGADGEAAALAGPLRHLPRTGWGLRPRARWPGAVEPVRRLESAPFYARHLVQARTDPDRVARVGVHEELDLERFRAGWVRGLLPFRVRRERA